jgi:hypothetical protein
MACSVPGLPRLAMRLPSKISRTRLRHQGVTGPRGPSPPHTCIAPSCVQSRCVPQLQNQRRAECSPLFARLFAPGLTPPHLHRFRSSLRLLFFAISPGTCRKRRSVQRHRSGQRLTNNFL